MISIKPIIYCICIFICGTSCQRQINTKEKLIEYVNEPGNGLRQTMEFGEIKIGLTFKPWQLMPNDNLNKKIMKNQYYFVLSLSKKDKELLRQLPYDQYSGLVQILAFRMTPLVSMVLDNGKHIQAQDCFFQQTYGMAKENEVLLIFEKRDLENTKILSIKVKEFGLNIGDLDFKLYTDDIKNTPTINI